MELQIKQNVLWRARSKICSDSFPFEQNKTPQVYSFRRRYFESDHLLFNSTFYWPNKREMFDSSISTSHFNWSINVEIQMCQIFEHDGKDEEIFEIFNCVSSVFIWHWVEANYKHHWLFASMNFQYIFESSLLDWEHCSLYYHFKSRYTYSFIEIRRNVSK